MSIYIECDICGERELADKDTRRYKKIRPYWLTPVLILALKADQEEQKLKLKDICVCENCDKVFNKRVKEFNDENINWFDVIIDATREELEVKAKSKNKKEK